MTRQSSPKTLFYKILQFFQVGDVQLLKKVLEDLGDETINLELGVDRWTALHIAAQVSKYCTQLSFFVSQPRKVLR